MSSARFDVARLSLAAFVFLTLVLCTSWASATVFEQCESGPIMSVPSVDSSAPSEAAPQLGEPQLGEMLFSELASDAEESDCDGLIIERSGQVPICLLEGASGVAERPIHDVDGAAIEAAPGTCMEAQQPDQATAPSDKLPTEAPQAGPYALATPPAPRVSPPVMVIATTRRPQDAAVPIAQQTRVFRPPRA
jgi:hypothetical protein